MLEAPSFRDLLPYRSTLCAVGHTISSTRLSQREREGTATACVYSHAHPLLLLASASSAHCSVTASRQTKRSTHTYHKMLCTRASLNRDTA